MKSATRQKTVFIVLNTTWNLVNFRSSLIKALVAAGYRVIAVAPPDDHVPRLMRLGCEYQPLAMDSGGTNPFRDVVLTWRFFLLLKKFQPLAFLPYTPKPNIYGSMAANLLGIPVINNVAGLGSVFIKGGWLAKLVKLLYRTSLAHSKKVFFQNPDDRDFFVAQGLVKYSITDLLPGSGIDLQYFTPTPKPDIHQPFRFLLLSRMLKDKGIFEFVAAARMLRPKFPDVQFVLLGFLDVENPTAVSRELMAQWQQEGVIQYHGEAQDVRAHIAAADCVVLPSYREGTPRTLLEAAAMAKPIITTTAIGCRQVVEDGINGFACNIADSDDLAHKMALMLNLTSEQRANMGRKGRLKVEREFDQSIVIQRYLTALALLT